MTIVYSAIIWVQKIERHLFYIKFVNVDNYGYLPEGEGGRGITNILFI